MSDGIKSGLFVSIGAHLGKLTPLDLCVTLETRLMLGGW